MPGRGPAPSPRRARARADHKLETLEAPTKLSGFPLPTGILPDGEPWHPRTVELWKALRRSPLTAGEPDTGWQFLLDTALMHHVMWTRLELKLAGEIRLRLAKFGVTPEDRMRLKVKVEVPGPTGAAAPKGVASLDERRGRLTG